MDNNTPPPSNDKNNSESAVNSDPQEVSTEEEISIDSNKSQFATKKNLVPIIGVGAVVLIIAIYALSSIFSSPPESAELNPIDNQRKNKGVVAKGGNIPKSGYTMTGVGGGGSRPSMSLPPPPPPPVESPIYTPPPMMIPPTVPKPRPLMTPSKGGGGSMSASSTSVASSSLFEEPPPPPPPPAPPAAIRSIGKTRGIDLKDDASKKRLRSNMLVMNGGGSGSGDKNSLRGRNATFSQNSIRATIADKAIATGLNNLNMTIAQGKIVYAVLETAINTELPGTLRAIVSRDTYAEAGRDVLIPKGSRLIGTYSADVIQGQSRVLIVWTRMIRPDGIDIEISSPAIDSLGRAGIKGNTDNKFTEIFSAAILTTTISIAGAVATEAVLPTTAGNSSTTTTTPGGNTTTTATPAQRAAGRSLRGLSKSAEKVVDKLIDVRPTITIDQGALINVFVNRDLTFPNNLNGGMFIQ